MTLRLKYLISFLLVLLVLCSAQSFGDDQLLQDTSATRDTILAASEPDYPPYCILNENGEPDGFAVDLLKQSAEAVGLYVRFEVGPWQSIKQHLIDDKIDVLPIVAETPARKDLYDFTIPFFSLQGTVFRRENGPKIKQISDLKKLRVYVMKGDNAEEYARSKNLSDQLMTSTTFEEAFQQLANGEADAVITQRIIGDEIIKRLDLRTVKPIDLQLPDFRFNFCFAVKEGNDLLLDKLNEGLSIIMATGQYNEIHRKWFGSAIHERLTFMSALRIVLYYTVPAIIVLALLGIFLLRKEVRKRTEYLNEEISLHEKTYAELKEQQQLLEASEAQIRLLLNSTNEGIFAINLKGNCVWVNQAAIAMLRYRDEHDLLGKNIHEIIHHTRTNGSFYSYHECKIQKSLKKGEGVVETDEVYWRADNSSFEVEYSSHPIKENGELKGAVVTFRDISDRKKQEKALLESEEKFRSIFKNHSAPKLLIDPENLSILEANQAASDLYGWPLKWLIGKKLREIVYLSDEEFHERLNILLQLKYRNVETKHLRADGSVFDVEVFSSVFLIGRKKYIHAIIHDISEKRIAERQNRLLKRAVEQSPVVMLITDREGMIEYTNPAFTQVTGFTSEEAIGKTPRILKSGDHDASFYEAMWSNILAGKEWTGELRNRKKDGDLYWDNTVISPIFDELGQLTHFIAVKEDITQKKALIRELIVAKEKAVESERLKSAFLANMSHEIRTPMNSILGFLKLLQDPEITNSTRTGYFSYVQNSSARLLSTINDIIEISKLEASQSYVDSDRINTKALFSKLKNIFLDTEEKQKNVDFNINNELPADFVIETDKVKLESILFNLLKNAFKFTSQGYINLGCRLDENKLLFYVEDSGLGIEIEKLNTIFDRFTQGDLNLTRAYEGAGLGLSIAKQYAELLDGNLWAVSEIGKGSTFFLQIPVREKGSRI